MVVKLVVAAPVRLKVVPLWVIPFRNSNGEVLAEENEQLAFIVRAPINKLEPVLLLSVMAAVPESVVVELAVKVAVLKFNDPEIDNVPETVTDPVLVSVMALVMDTMFRLMADAPPRFWALVVKVCAPVPVKLKVVPLWVIPPRNSNGELLAEENEQPAPTVTNPVKRLVPELLLSEIEAVPESVVAPPAVKLAELRFKAPVWVMVPVNVTDPEVLHVKVPDKAVVPDTDSVPDPLKSMAAPELMVSVPIVTLPLIVVVDGELTVTGVKLNVPVPDTF